MVQKGLLVRGLVASPGDVPKERQAVTDVIVAWNATHSWDRAIIIEPVKWESHSVPLQGDRPQSLINKQLLRKCDFLVGVFWTRLGTDTGVAPSGTVEEIREFIAEKKPVLLYFSDQPVAPGSIDPAQWEKLQAFKKEMRGAGLQQDYSDVNDFRLSLFRHLTDVVNRTVSNVGLKINENDNAKSNFDDGIRAQLASIMSRLSAEWEAERDSEPMSLDDGKFILANARDQLIGFISLENASLTDEVKRQLKESVKNIKQMQRAQVFLDGGKSFNEFWENGDLIVKELSETVALIGRV